MPTIFSLACLLLILDISVLPAAAFLRIAHVNEALIFLRYGQYKIAESLENRYDQLYYAMGYSREDSDDRIWDRRFETSDAALYLYHRGYFKSSIAVTADGKGPRGMQQENSGCGQVETIVFAQGIDWILQKIHPKFNRIAIEARGLSNDSGDLIGTWADIVPAPAELFRCNAYLVLHHHHYQNVPFRGRSKAKPSATDIARTAHQELLIQSEFPDLILLRSWFPGPFFGTVTWVAFGVALFFLGLRWLLVRIFQINLLLPEEAAIPIPSVVSRHSLLLSSPWQANCQLPPPVARRFSIWRRWWMPGWSPPIASSSPARLLPWWRLTISISGSATRNPTPRA